VSRVAELAAHEVHVWRARPASIATPEQHAQARAVLSVDERSQLDRFVLERPRQEYLAAHVLVRTTLSRYADVAPEAWEFRTGPWGRPELVAPNAPIRLRFNLTHTDGLVACAVTRDRDVGIDAEARGRRPTTPDLADHFFAPAEAAALRALPEPMRSARFLDYWTLKEAYIKARGMGLAIPLDRFWFDLDGAELAFTALDDEPARWWFARLALGPQHVAAVCVERGERAPALVVHETTQL
jgi:4'-phosphopantetheinyl transferase